MSSRSPSARRCGPSKNTQVPFRLPRSRTTSAPFSHETFACSGERNTSSVKRMSPANRPDGGAGRGSGEPAAAVGTEGEQAAGAASTKGAGGPFGPGGRDDGRSHDARHGNPRPGGGRLEARGLDHGFAAIHAELRPGVV